MFIEHIAKYLITLIPTTIVFTAAWKFWTDITTYACTEISIKRWILVAPLIICFIYIATSITRLIRTNRKIKDEGDVSSILDQWFNDNTHGAGWGLTISKLI